MTLLPPIPPASLPSGLDSMRKIAGGIAGTPVNRMPTGYRALVGAAQVCAGILLTLMGISAGKMQSEYGTRTSSLLKDAPPLLLVATGILLGLAGVVQLVHTFWRGQGD